MHIYSQMLAGFGRLKEALKVREHLRVVEPFAPVYNISTADIMWTDGQRAASIAMLEAIPAESQGGYLRNVRLARGYAALGRYSDAADTLLLITGNQVSRKSVDEAAELLRTAQKKTDNSQELPLLEGELNFVYAHFGALERVLEYPERLLALGYTLTTTIYPMWLPEYAPLRKGPRFKALMRNLGLVDYWKARGWPDLCRPQGADDFVCD